MCHSTISIRLLQPRAQNERRTLHAGFQSKIIITNLLALVNATLVRLRGKHRKSLDKRNKKLNIRNQQREIGQKMNPPSINCLIALFLGSCYNALLKAIIKMITRCDYTTEVILLFLLLRTVHGSLSCRNTFSVPRSQRNNARVGMKTCVTYENSLTFYTQTSVCIFSILFSTHFLRCYLAEFV